MVHEDSGARTSVAECIYWSGVVCRAGNFFSPDDISCYHEGNCNGFGTCRDCSKYDQGGLKLDSKALQADGSVETQTPMNLQVLNIRARTQPCCFWDGLPVDFSKSSTAAHHTPIFITGFEGSGQTVPPSVVAERLAVTAEATKCTLSEAAPWQVAFTADNPTARGCNGAKPECPFYTGPRYNEVVDAKMDTGNRVTAKQIMELRYHSADWKSFANPREEWERRFEEPDIWAWARDIDTSSNRLPGGGKSDEFGNPLVEKVTIANFSSEEAEFSVDPPVPIHTGTPTLGRQPDFPTLVRELSLLSSGMRVLWPANTSSTEPLVRETFTSGERFIYISVLVNSSRDIFAVNITKHAQEGEADLDFVRRLKREQLEDVVPPVTTGMPGKTFIVPLVLEGQRQKLNSIKIFLDTGATDGSMLTAEVHVDHIFHHADVGQTSFIDFYGHAVVDPWINHFTRIKIEADVLHLTNNTDVHDVLWNTIASDGRVTMYTIETQKEVSSEDEGEISWEPVGCGHIAVTFESTNINRVYPWTAWGEDSKGSSLFVKVDRTGRTDLADSEPTEVEMELAFASTKGTAMPPNVAIFKLQDNTAVRPFDVNEDILQVRYAYTEYKQGPISDEDIAKLKFASDINKVITMMPYGYTFDTTEFITEGTFLKMGSADSGVFETTVHTCDQLLGDCYTEKSFENEEQARKVFFAGGLGESTIKGHSDMVSECIIDFNSRHAGLVFEDGTTVSYTEAASRLGNVHLREGSQHYMFVFKDRNGRPVGTKTKAFLTQSAMVQTRDVEVRYKWGAHMQHYPNIDGMILTAALHKPIRASTQDRLVRIIQEYDPICGDHAETTAGNAAFRAFDLDTDRHGPLWYPYKRCETPQYHADSSVFSNVIEYSDTIEGFGGIEGGLDATGHRRDYWERMRFWDQYMPAIMNWIPQLGCFWSERTTTLYASRPVLFTGYTKVRSSHLFGEFGVDREAVRVSRHWEKRNLSFQQETIDQEEGGESITIDTGFAAAMFDENGNLNEGADLQTPIWVHINDGLSVVTPATEEVEHPYNHLLMSRVGSHSFGESFVDDRISLKDTVVERDYTSALVRSEDGSTVYLPDGTELTAEEGTLFKEELGSDIRWVFKDQNTAWAWAAAPSAPVRGSPRITGLFLSNPAQVIYKKTRTPATHTTEGNHTITYTPHEFTTSGTISASASLSMDDGPSLLVSQTTGIIFILADSGSPYDIDEHEGEDYQFVLLGNGPGGVGILADGRGLQRYEVDEEKFATLAGVSINPVFDIDELPYEVVDIRTLSRLADAPLGGTEQIGNTIGEYGSDDVAPITIPLDFQGHYYVETVTVDFVVGGDFDVPVINIEGVEKEVGEDVSDGVFSDGATNTSYLKGNSITPGTSNTQTFSLNQRYFSLLLHLGARLPDRKMKIENIQVKLRNHVESSEEVFIFEPRFQVSTGNTGTHKPSDLELFFQRVEPEFSKSYLSGQLSVGALDLGQGITAIAGVDIKFTGRQIKDILPYFEFTDPSFIRFPYSSIDLEAIPGHTTAVNAAGTFNYINSPVQVSSKGWTMYTTRHFEDPLDKLFPTDTGPEGVQNVYAEENGPQEDLQEILYSYASDNLLGDRVAEFTSFWHPTEVEFFADSGVDLGEFAWALSLRSEVAPIDRVYRHQSYGCIPSITSENLDGFVHQVENWQAKGVFHYQCDARYSWACFTTVMNKCNSFLFTEYGTPSYNNTDVLQRFKYVWVFPPREHQSYINSDLINQNEQGGIIGGTGPVGSAIAASVPAPNIYDLQRDFHTNLPPKGPGPYS